MRVSFPWSRSARVISGREKGRTSESQITVVDPTGVAVQDIKIATAVYRALK